MGTLIKRGCECGCDEYVASTKRFVVGHNMRCQDLTGAEFGKLKVLGPAPEIVGRSGRRWLCRCSCGKENYFRGSRLKSGVSSGCQSCNNGFKLRPFESLYNLVISVNRPRGIEVGLTYDDFLAFTQIDKCHYCSTQIEWNQFHSNSGGYKLDRKDNAGGYTKDNCVVCCPRCNRAKSDTFTYEEFVQLGAVIKGWAA